MSILSFFTKTPEIAAETVRDSAKAGLSLIDEAFHTDQEKAEAKAKILDTYARLWEVTTKESTGTSEARRWLLHRITDFTLYSAGYCILLQSIGVLKPEWEPQTTALVTVVTAIITTWQIGWAFVAGVSFYYMTHIAQAAGGKAN